MKKQPDEFLYDLRLVERHIRNGRITREDANKFFGAAEDMAEQADFLDLDVLRGQATDRDNASDS